MTTLPDVFAPARRALAEAKSTLCELRKSHDEMFRREAKRCRTGEDWSLMRHRMAESWDTASKPFVQQICYLESITPPRMILRADGVFEHVEPGVAE